MATQGHPTGTSLNTFRSTQGDLNQLVTSWRIREGERASGANRAERRWLDFVVDNSSLHEMLGAQALDLIGGFGWGTDEGRSIYLEQLLLQRPSELQSKRVPIFICPECGDLGCGAITARIIATEDAFSWADFGYENTYDPTLPSLKKYVGIGPFVFEKAKYIGILQSAAAALPSE
jgi:hypothetical protein